MKRIPIIFSKQKVILGAYLGVSLLTAIWQYAYGAAKYDHFLVLRTAFHLLSEQKNLYLQYPEFYIGKYSYHPILSILFAPFDFLSIATGMIVWLSLVAYILFYSIKSLPISDDDKVVFLWLILAELAISLNSQLHDPLVGALGLLTLSSFQRNQSKRAALYPVLACCLQPYAILFAALFVFYPSRRRYVFRLLIWMFLVCLAPLYFTSLDYFILLYKHWFTFLTDSILHLADASTTVQQSWTSLVNTRDTFIFSTIFFMLVWIVNLVRIADVDRKRMLLLLAYCCLWISILQNGPWVASNFLTALGLILFFLASKEKSRPYLTTLSMILLIITFSVGMDIYVTDWIYGAELLQLTPGIIVLLTLQFRLLFSNHMRSLTIK